MTARDVAKAAGVSTGTVSRVINMHPAVAEDVRQKVLAAIQSLGWQPNAVARSMRTARTRTIGCIFADVRNPLYANIIQGAEQAFAESGYTLMVASSGGDFEPRGQAHSAVRQQACRRPHSIECRRRRRQNRGGDYGIGPADGAGRAQPADRSLFGRH